MLVDGKAKDLEPLTKPRFASGVPPVVRVLSERCERYSYAYSTGVAQSHRGVAHSAAAYEYAYRFFPAKAGSATEYECDFMPCSTVGVEDQPRLADSPPQPAAGCGSGQNGDR